MLDLLWLLLPVAAFSGWWTARRSLKKSLERMPCDTSPEYFRGLNYLLNEEPDKAIDVFVQMLEVDSDTVETHLALGNLFRRRGEVERAIRIHQNLIARPALTRNQRAQALLELGQDYMKAGLFDRAENLFKELKEMDLYKKKALKNLRVIYQQEKDWQACLDVSEELAPLTSESIALERSHYYCEMAEDAIRFADLITAQSLLKKALQTNRKCVRATHLMAKISAIKEDYKSAIKLLRQAGEQDNEYLPEILPTLIEYYKRAGDLAGLSLYLRELVNANKGSITAIMLMTDYIKETEGVEQATDFLSKEIGRSPSLRGLLKLMELNDRLPSQQSADLLIKLRTHIEQMLAERPIYQCSKCGFSAKTLHWQCPSCRNWSSIKRKPELDNH